MWLLKGLCLKRVDFTLQRCDSAVWIGISLSQSCTIHQELFDSGESLLRLTRVMPSQLECVIKLVCLYRISVYGRWKAQAWPCRLESCPGPCAPNTCWWTERKSCSGRTGELKLSHSDIHYSLKTYYKKLFLLVIKQSYDWHKQNVPSARRLVK